MRSLAESRVQLHIAVGCLAVLAAVVGAPFNARWYTRQVTAQLPWPCFVLGRLSGRVESRVRVAALLRRRSSPSLQLANSPGPTSVGHGARADRTEGDGHGGKPQSYHSLEDRVKESPARRHPAISAPRPSDVIGDTGGTRWTQLEEERPR
jgi:hypothetical protein